MKTQPDAIKNLLTLKKKLKFKDGHFRIMMISDVQDGYPITETICAAVEALIEKEQPDLVLLGGDNVINIQSEKDFTNYLKELTDPMRKRSIPWAHVFGNHDDQYGPRISKEAQQQIYESFADCISKAGPAEIHGIGNYVLPILSSDDTKIAFNVWGLDSNTYLSDYSPVLDEQVMLGKSLPPATNYDFIHFDQIHWYWNTSVALEKYNGAKIPALMYFHIPLPEFKIIARNPEQTNMTGALREGICSSHLNSGLFTTLLQRGDVKGVFCGHDHINDFAGTYCGIKLGYASTLGYNTYNDPDSMGARMFVIQENNAESFSTYMSYIKREIES